MVVQPQGREEAALVQNCSVPLPLVMRGQASLPAVPLLVFMLVIGSWGGLLGVLMAPPLFAVLLLAWRRFWVKRMDAV